jgi:hypothetical protein
VGAFLRQPGDGEGHPDEAREGRRMKPYQVRRYDNGHFADSGEEPDLVGEFDTIEDAIAAANLVVDESLRHLAAGSSSVDDLLNRFSDWGDSASIVGRPSVTFPAWETAKKRARIIFDEVKSRAARNDAGTSRRSP